jgi:hypothetical protein
MNRREFINLAGAVAVGVAGADTLKDLMVKGPSGVMVGDAGGIQRFYTGLRKLV